MNQNFLNKIKYLISLLVIFSWNIVFAAPASLGGFEKPTLDNPLSKYSNIMEIFGDIPGIILTLAGIIFMVVMLVGSYQYLIAAGKQESVEKAKNIFLTGLIGLIVIILAIPAVKWVYSNLN